MSFAGALFFLGFLAALFLSFIALLQFLSQQISLRQFIFWEFLFIGILLLTLFPSMLDVIAGLLGVDRVRGLFALTVGLLIVYGLIYNLYSYRFQSEKQIRKLQQDIALLNYRFDYDVRPETQEKKNE